MGDLTDEQLDELERIDRQWCAGDISDASFAHEVSGAIDELLAEVRRLRAENAGKPCAVCGSYEHRRHHG
jgi:hypothetical protein